MADVVAGSDRLLQLQNDVENVLRRIVSTFTNAQALGADWTGGQMGGIAAAMERMRDDVASVVGLELRMPVVAPVKAGKSTLINAIIGYELLPIRNLPMTMLPTKIVLDDVRTEPELRLAEHATQADRNAQVFDDIVRRLLQAAPAHADRLGEKHAHLQPLFEQLAAGQPIPVKTIWTGHAEVQRALLLLNDLLRLASLVVRDDDWVRRLEDIPVLCTPHRLRWGRSPRGLGGRLAIIDTPGPNEGSISAVLTEVVSRQLRQGHVVLVLLDFTVMGTDADATIRELAEPVLRLLGRDRLYAVVNKVDQRRQNASDLDPSGVTRFVQHGLGLLTDGAAGRIYETSARRALLAAQVLSEVAESGARLDVHSNQAVAGLMEEVVGDAVFREQFLQRMTPDMIRELAWRTWNESGLPALVEGAISGLRDQAIPGVLSASLSKFDGSLADLSGVVEIRLKTEAAGMSEVGREVDQLATELEELKQARSNLDRAGLARRVEAALRDSLDRARRRGRAVLEELDRGLPEAGAAEAPAQSPRLLRHVGGSLTVDAERTQRSEVEFPSEQSARAFRDQLSTPVVEDLRRILDETREDVRAQIPDLARREVVRQVRKAREIIERAARRLSTVFDVEPLVPPPDVAVADLSPELSDPSVQDRAVLTTFDVQRTRRLWYTLWLFEHREVVTEQREVTRQTYVVSRSAIKSELQEAFDETLRRTSEELYEYVARDLTGHIDDHFADLDAFLRRYHDSLVRAQDDAGNDQAQREADRSALAALASEVELQRRAIAACQARLR